MRYLLFGLLVLAFAHASLAKPTPAITDPKAFVISVYQKLSTDKDYSPSTDIYTNRLAALWADMNRDANGEVGRVDFEFWTDAQDWEIKNLEVVAGLVWGRPDRQVVTAKFLNGDRAEEIHFYFEKVGRRWLLDDACSYGKQGWTLSLLLKYGFY